MLKKRLYYLDACVDLESVVGVREKVYEGELEVVDLCPRLVTVGGMRVKSDVAPTFVTIGTGVSPGWTILDTICVADV